jgi:hypothetical protein
MRDEGVVELDVYVENGCRICERAIQIAREVEEAYPLMAVRVRRAKEAPEAEDIFAVPTFVLNGRVISLGNPDWSDLRRAIESEVGPATLS